MAAAPALSRLESALRAIARDLDALGRPWALVGGLAVSARTEPRFTRDIDVVVAVATDSDAERLVRDLGARGYRAEAIVEHEPTGRLATARLVPAGGDEGGVVTDLLLASSGIESEVAAAAEAIEVLPRLTVPVAAVGHLVALKILARDDSTRPQDRMDLVALLGVVGPADLEQARIAIGLIADRGFHRGRDLAGDLDRLLTSGAGPRP